MGQAWDIENLRITRRKECVSDELWSRSVRTEKDNKDGKIALDVFEIDVGGKMQFSEA